MGSPYGSHRENLIPIPIPMGMGISMGIPIPTATCILQLYDYKELVRLDYRRNRELAYDTLFTVEHNN